MDRARKLGSAVLFITVLFGGVFWLWPPETFSPIDRWLMSTGLSGEEAMLVQAIMFFVLVTIGIKLIIGNQQRH